MVKQEIYKINDFSCGVEETIYWHKFGHIHTGLSHSERKKTTQMCNSTQTHGDTQEAVQKPQHHVFVKTCTKVSTTAIRIVLHSWNCREVG